MFLKNKDCAKILFGLYRNFFSRSGNEEINISTDISEAQRKKYSIFSELTTEEIWAYDYRLIYISDDNFLNRLEEIRERAVSKKSFIYMVCFPTYKFFLRQSSECIGIIELEHFGLQHGLFKDVCNEKNFKEWLLFEPEAIRIADAEKIAENVKDFLTEFIKK